MTAEDFVFGTLCTYFMFSIILVHGNYYKKYHKNRRLIPKFWPFYKGYLTVCALCFIPGFFSDIIDAINGLLLGFGLYIFDYLNYIERYPKYEFGEKEVGCLFYLLSKGTTVIVVSIFLLGLRIAHHFNYY